MANQNSIIVYTPQPYFTPGSCTVVADQEIADIENSSGLFSPDLSDYTTVVPNTNQTDFGVLISFDKIGDYLSDINMSVALIGCSMLTYEDDGGGSPDLDTVFNEGIRCFLTSNIGTNGDTLVTQAHSSQNDVRTFCREPLPGIISGGQANLIFHGVGTSGTNNSLWARVLCIRANADVVARPHARFVIGHFMVGIDLPITINPKTFSWRLGLDTKRFESRDSGNISSDGTLVRQASGEIIKISNYSIVGTEVTATSVGDLVPNFFDLTKFNNSYPLLISPYPIGAIAGAGLTPEEANLTLRQNFFSIYGFLEDSLEFQPGEYRDGLDSEFRARFRIRETR